MAFAVSNFLGDDVISRNLMNVLKIQALLTNEAKIRIIY